MNQILYNKIGTINKSNTKKRFFYKIVFSISIFLFILTIIKYLYNIKQLNSEELIAKQISNNYGILKLYNNYNLSEGKKYYQNGYSFTVIGMIEIPKAHIYYPIINEYNDELLKIAPCRISGPMPNRDGNLCIAGHNYDNYKFFSNITSLEINDSIIIYNLNGDSLSYTIYDIYEVIENDLSPLNNLETIKKQVTLITCNNFHSNKRIIIKAKNI